MWETEMRTDLQNELRPKEKQKEKEKEKTRPKNNSDGKDFIRWFTKGHCSFGEACAFKHDPSKKGNGKARPRSLSALVHLTEIRKMTEKVAMTEVLKRHRNLLVTVRFVDFTCLNCFCQTHFASAVEHELVDPDVECVLSWRRVSCEQQLDTFQPRCRFCGIHSVSGMHLWSVF